MRLNYPILTYNQVKVLEILSNRGDPRSLTSKEFRALGISKSTLDRAKEKLIQQLDYIDVEPVRGKVGYPEDKLSINERGKGHLDGMHSSIKECLGDKVATLFDLKECTGFGREVLDCLLEWLNKEILHICDLYALPNCKDKLVHNLHDDLAKRHVSIGQFAEKLMDSFFYKGCEAREYIGFIDMFLTKEWEWRQILTLLEIIERQMTYFAHTKAKIPRLSDELVNECRSAYIDYYGLIISKAARIEIPSGGRFSGSQALKAVTEGKIDMEYTLAINFSIWPRHKLIVVLKPESTSLRESHLVKQRKLKFREIIFSFLNTALINPRKFKKIVEQGYEEGKLNNVVEMGVARKLKGFEVFGSLRVYMGVESQTGTIPAPWEKSPSENF